MKIHLFDRTTDFTVAPAGHVVFRAGDPADSMYVVIGGEVDIVVKDRVIETIDAGGVFGEMALIEDLPRSATAIVKSEAKLVAVNRNRFLFMVQQTPYFSLQLLSIATDRLRRLMAEKL
jgi:CRP/FNR family cyclic AMP-dependent transcriptional regulator